MDPHPAKPPVRHQWHRTAGPGKNGSILLHLSPLLGSATEILENRDLIIQVFQALNSRRLASSDREPSARVENLPALARAPSHSMCLVATRKTPARASVNANFKFVAIEHVGFPCCTKLSATSFLFALTEGLLLAFFRPRWKLFEHFCHAPIEVLFILRRTFRQRVFGATPPN